MCNSCGGWGGCEDLTPDPEDVPVQQDNDTTPTLDGDPQPSIGE